MSQPVMVAQSTALVSSLTEQRNHVLGILRGPPEEALRRPVLPSGWTCHAGHLDAARELIDGRTWLVLTE